jgi:membrane peptidoglycan carboxypeptidase
MHKNPDNPYELPPQHAAQSTTQPITELPEPHPKKVLYKSKPIWAAAVLVGLILIVATFLLMSHKSPTETSMASHGSHKSSLTLYYRDGKTVLWSSAADNTTDVAPGFTAYAIAEFQKYYGVKGAAQGEWKITTSLDLEKQRSAAAALLSQHDELATHNVKNNLFIAQDITNGQIVSWVDSRKTDNPASIHEAEAAHQNKLIEPGTLMLPFVYATLFEQTDTTDSTVLDDSRGPLPGYPCTSLAPAKPTPTPTDNCLYNFDRRFLGQITARQALAGVRVVPAVKAAQTLDSNPAEAINKIMATAEKLGVDGACYQGDLLDTGRPVQCYQAALQGDGFFAAPQTIVQAYATLASNGVKKPTTPFMKITLNDAEKTEWQQTSSQALSKEVAGKITDILKDKQASYMKTLPSAFATPNGEQLGAMSGTTASYQNFGMVQFSKKYAAGYWTLGDGAELTGTLEKPVADTVSNWMNGN